jgi:hypothetical protein
MLKTRVAALLLGMSALTCHQAPFTAPAGSHVQLFANPGFIPPHGGVSVVTAFLTKPNGTPVADGTVVQFFTDLGFIDPQGRTNDGIAQVNLVSDGRSGEAHIIAVSGGAATSTSGGTGSGGGTGGGTGTGSGCTAASGSGTSSATVCVRVGGKLVNLVVVTAFPQRLTDKRASHITANVYDDQGNPVPNVAVIFSVDGDEERMDSQGTPIFTDNNGQALDIMRTDADPDEQQRVVTVTAQTTTADQKKDDVKVTIN